MQPLNVESYRPASQHRRSRILIVDDSAVMRSLLRSIIGADPRFEVAGTAADGGAALQAAANLNPDLMVLDVEMPVLDGLGTLKQLRARGNSIPVIMCSSLTQRGARVTVEALACGAADYVAKPSGASNRDQAISALRSQLLPRIAALVRAQHAHGEIVVSNTPCAARETPSLPQQPPGVVVIGVSTGGPAALDVILPQLPRGFGAPVLVVQHMPQLFTGLMAERLNTRCQLPVVEAREEAEAQPGTIVIARGDWHLEIKRVERGVAFLQLTQAPPENHCRPAIDVLLRSVASTYGGSAMAIILTGMGCDGLAGCRELHRLGGTVIAQNEASSAVWGMPGAVVHAGLADRILPLDEIGPEVVRRVFRKGSDAREICS